MFKRYNLLLFNTIFILYLEIVFKAFIFNSVFNINTIFTVLFSLCTAFILSIIESLFGKILNKIIMIAFSVIIWLIFTSQFIYYQYYETIFSVYSLFHGSQVLEFINSIFTVMLNNIIPIILMIIPIIFMFVYIKKIDNERKNCKFYLIVILWILICFFGCLGLMKMLNNDDTYSSYNLYYNTHVPKLTVKNLGLITEIRLDIKRTLFGFKENIILTNSDNTILEDNTVYHIMEIDFEDLINNETDETIKQMDEYFSSVSPTATNEYTGMFEGKNLIYIIAEAFSPMAINEELTPTLYKLYNEGFQFENFYTPVFYVSTSDGEYTTLTSLLPEDGVWSMSRSSDIYLPFVYGNLFKDYGYNAYAYHDGTYTYYNRDESLPNMGYTYKACYNGLNINCGMWPQSDIEMMDATVEEYINDDNFVTYYMTISGHLEYTYNGNSIATKNRSYVEDLDYSEAIQAYLATQIELDRAISDLIDQLDAAGK
ncbi:MAG TPA: sulfatase-like hydrolase/transferase, partial [Bacilli bacterium]|nr:sulfatase-like hydrolase/transferase [Bacilli bacterium]